MGKVQHRIALIGEDGVAQVASDWTDTEDDELNQYRMDNMERVLQTLAWENGGSLVVSKDRFLRAIKEVKDRYPGSQPGIQMGVGDDFIVFEIVDYSDEMRATGVPLGGRRQ